VLSQLARNLRRAGLADRIRLVGPRHLPEIAREARQAYLTAAATQRQVDRLVALAGPATEWLLPRQLDNLEFGAEPEASWLRTRFGTYDGYTMDAEWNSYCAIEAFQVDQNQNRIRRSVVYDTTFVKLVE
jgi:hypothetical protein